MRYHCSPLVQRVMWSPVLGNYSLMIATALFRICVIALAVLTGAALFYRTTNLWTLKNIGDTFITKQMGRRPIIIGAFHRMKREQNVDGNFVVMQFVGDSRQAHSLYCSSVDEYGDEVVSRAHIERIHKGKRAASDVCSWAGHIAECSVGTHQPKSIKVRTTREGTQSIKVAIEKVLDEPRHDLVVCMAPMYTYTDWQIMLLGIENWLALGATKIVVPIQSASSNALRILEQYQRHGIVILRQWPKWPVLSDVNPNGLVLSRGIEESHVNCLFFVKPWADMVVFTDVDDMLIPVDPQHARPGLDWKIIQELSREHPRAGSFLFEHRDVQLVLPTEDDSSTISKFNFDFLDNSHWKSSCKVWRMKTRVVVNASRVDSVNMHETGIHRFGYVQVRVPCHRAHFYHMRHSYSDVEHSSVIDMSALKNMLNDNFRERLSTTLKGIANAPLNKSSTESFADFDKCVIAITEEHFKMKVSRCMTPHVCYSRTVRDIDCMASEGHYEFVHSNGDFVIALTSATLTDSDPNCESPIPKIVKGNYFYLP